jgi:hypothetical protein
VKHNAGAKLTWEYVVDVGAYSSLDPRQRRQRISLMHGEWPACWEPQEEGVMSIAASFPSVKKPRFIVLGEERQTTEGDAC